MSAAGVSAHDCMARALALTDAALVMPMEFPRLPMVGLAGFLRRFLSSALRKPGGA